MIDRETVTAIRDEYPWASWAIWDAAFPDGDCVETTPDDLGAYMVDRHSQMSADVVLLGLNRSDDLDAPFENFHAPTRKHFDFRLKETIQDGDLDRLHGAYMTDLVDEIDPDSSTVTVTDSDARRLLDQLRVLGESDYRVLCFGNKPFRALVDYFDLDVTTYAPELEYTETTVDGTTLHLYRVWFYGLYGANQDKVETFREQLHCLDELFSNGAHTP